MSASFLKRIVLSAFVTVASAAAVQAGVIFTPGNIGVTGQENVQFGAGAQTASAITGQSQVSDIDVVFTSTHTLFLQGNAVVATDVNPITVDVTNLSLATPGYTFQNLIFNLQNGDGSATVTAHTVASGDFTYDFELGNGQNFLTVAATGTDAILSLMIEADGFARLLTPRIAGLLPIGDGETPVPEPISLALLGLGLAGLSFARRRRV